MRILYVIESLGRGGAERALVNLLPALQARGIECEVAVLWSEVAVLGSPYPLASELEKRGIQVHYLNLHHRWSIIEGIAKMVVLLRKGHFDIVHAHLFFAEFYTALSCPLVPLPRRVVSFQNLGYTAYPANTLWKKFRKRMHSFLIRYCTQFQIGCSTAVAKHYSAHLKLQNVKVIYHLFPVDELQPNPKLDKAKVRARYNVTPDEFVIIMPGRFVPEKNHSGLLEALRLLKQRNLRPRLLIVGEGPLKDLLRQKLVDEQLLEQVVLHDMIPKHEELMRVVQAMDIFVMPSISEGFPLAPAEAMALEKPVLATSVGGLTELIENKVSGLLVPPGDASSLADKIAQLMADPALRERLGQGGRKRIETCFSLEMCADHYVNYYKTIVAHNNKE